MNTSGLRASHLHKYEYKHKYKYKSIIRLLMQAHCISMHMQCALNVNIYGLCKKTHFTIWTNIFWCLGKYIDIEVSCTSTRNYKKMQSHWLHLFYFSPLFVPLIVTITSLSLLLEILCPRWPLREECCPCSQSEKRSSQLLIEEEEKNGNLPHVSKWFDSGGLP